MANPERDIAKERLQQIDGIIFVDSLQERRAVFGSQHLFDYFYKLGTFWNDLSVISRNELSELSSTTIRSVPNEEWITGKIEPERDNKFATTQTIAYIKWKYLPVEFDVTNPNHPSQK